VATGSGYRQRPATVPQAAPQPGSTVVSCCVTTDMRGQAAASTVLPRARRAPPRGAASSPTARARPSPQTSRRPWPRPPWRRRGRHCGGGRAQRGGGHPTVAARVGEPPPREASGVAAGDGDGSAAGGGSRHVWWDGWFAWERQFHTCTRQVLLLIFFVFSFFRGMALSFLSILRCLARTEAIRCALRLPECDAGRVDY